jgi:hypothetical protein
MSDHWTVTADQLGTSSQLPSGPQLPSAPQLPSGPQLPSANAPSNPDDSTPLSLKAGEFRFYFADELWEWSAEVAEIHGYPAVEMRPTTDQVMWHKHSEDRAKMTAALDHVREHRAAVSTRHRIRDCQLKTHEVVVVSQLLLNDCGEVIGLQGFYVDVTPTEAVPHNAHSDLERQIDREVSNILQHRTVIDEVKGMLMVIYRIDDRRSFDLLCWRSIVTNTKVRELAEQLRAEFALLEYDEYLPPRSAFDQVLLTAHERIRPQAV